VDLLFIGSVAQGLPGCEEVEAVPAALQCVLNIMLSVKGKMKRVAERSGVHFDASLTGSRARTIMVGNKQNEKRRMKPQIGGSKWMNITWRWRNNWRGPAM
jgi:hypothetical protein